jgi:hypothetical protein
MTDIDKIKYIEFAKFLQTTILEKNIPCYLIGGSLINSIRDNGVLLTDDIDFAITSEQKDNSLLHFLIDSVVDILPFCTWNVQESMIRFKLYGRDDMKIDIFLFIKKHINYYMYDIAWINERIQNFQTFKEQKVILENKEFYTLYRPDLFLNTVYGDWLSPKKDYYNIKGGDTNHLRECVFYTNDESFNKIDFQVENLKIFFQSVVVKRSINNIDNKLINVFDACYSKQIDKKTNLFYEDFIYFLIKNKINFDNF